MLPGCGGACQDQVSVTRTCSTSKRCSVPRMIPSTYFSSPHRLLPAINKNPPLCYDLYPRADEGLRQIVVQLCPNGKCRDFIDLSVPKGPKGRASRYVNITSTLIHNTHDVGYTQPKKSQACSMGPALIVLHRTTWLEDLALDARSAIHSGFA